MDAPHTEGLVRRMEATVAGRHFAERNERIYDIAFVNGAG